MRARLLLLGVICGVAAQFVSVSSAYALPDGLLTLIWERPHKERTTEDLLAEKDVLDKDLASALEAQRKLGDGADMIITTSRQDYERAQALRTRIEETTNDLTTIEAELWLRSRGRSLRLLAVGVLGAGAVVIVVLGMRGRMGRGSSRTLRRAMDTGGTLEGDIVSRQDVLRLYGQPRQRIRFSRLEAWTYYFSRHQLDAPGTPMKGSTPQVESRIFLFDGDRLFDYSVQILDETGL